MGELSILVYWKYDDTVEGDKLRGSIGLRIFDLRNKGKGLREKIKIYILVLINENSFIKVCGLNTLSNKDLLGNIISFLAISCLKQKTKFIEK